MGATTYTQFKSRLMSRFGENSAFSSPTDYYGIWVNSAYRYLSTLELVSETKRHFFIPDLETSTTATTVDGTAYVSEPTDCLAIREVYDTTNNKRLDWLSWAEYIGKTDRTTAANENKPTYWHRRSGYIYLYPTPDSAYTITVYYKKIPADLSSGSDVTVLGSEWDDIILEIANYYGRMWTNEYDRAETCMKAAKSKMVELMDVYRTEEKARRERVAPDSQMTWRPTY